MPNQKCRFKKNGACLLNDSLLESRDGLEVVGTYSYVDPTGAIVTVK